jgi:hypothetical protein
MNRLLMLTGTFAIIWPLLGGQAQLALLSPGGMTGNSLVQQIGWRGCEFWQAKCAMRWGPTWRFGRCMSRHGCWVLPPPPPPLPPK